MIRDWKTIREKFLPYPLVLTTVDALKDFAVKTDGQNNLWRAYYNEALKAFSEGAGNDRCGRCPKCMAIWRAYTYAHKALESARVCETASCEWTGSASILFGSVALILGEPRQAVDALKQAVQITENSRSDLRTLKIDMVAQLAESLIADKPSDEEIKDLGPEEAERRYQVRLDEAQVICNHWIYLFEQQGEPQAKLVFQKAMCLVMQEDRNAAIEFQKTRSLLVQDAQDMNDAEQDDQDKRRQENVELHFRSTFNLGFIHFSLDELLEAEQMYLTCLAIADEVAVTPTMRQGLVRVNEEMSALLNKQGRPDEAQKYALQATVFSGESGQNLDLKMKK